MPWPQTYDPLHNIALSTLVAAIPIALLLTLIAVFRMRAHLAALLALASALLVAIAVQGMPARTAAATTVYGAAFGLFPIGWIVLNLIFLFDLTVKKGLFDILRGSLATVSPDPRVQVILIAFSFGAFFEGAAGFGTPVAITAAILMSLGFRALPAAGLSLIANTAPVAFGALGTPIIALSGVTGLDLQDLSRMVGRQLPVFSVIVPFWVVWAFAGFRGMLGVWPAALVAGVAFAVPQFLVSNYHGPWLVDVIASVASIIALVLLLRFWQPRDNWKAEGERALETIAGSTGPARPKADSIRAWVPWLLLSVAVFIWGIPKVKELLNSLSVVTFQMPYLHEAVQRVPPVAPPAAPPEKAIFTLNWLSATGTGILVSALLAGLIMGFRASSLISVYLQTLKRVRVPLITISAMLALGYVTRYSGADATLGLALAGSGVLYPFFGTFLGWLGVALTGSDTASNVLFGSLQRISSEKLGLSPILMAAANSSGGVMGKMVDAQSIVVASTATACYGQEGDILRYVFFHSIALATLVALLVTAQAYWPPFTRMVIQP